MCGINKWKTTGENNSTFLEHICVSLEETVPVLSVASVK